MKARIVELKRFAVHDGPGIRTTVFFKGCPLKCVWCHNPESIRPYPQLAFYENKCQHCGLCQEVCPSPEDCTLCGACTEICPAGARILYGRSVTVESLLPELLEDKTFFANSGGGVTLSGGEVLCHAEFAVELAKACHEAGIHVAIETNLSLPLANIQPLLDHVDLIMADCKLFDDDLHRKYTGISNETTLQNIRAIRNIPMIVRTPLIPGVTATAENLTAIAASLVGKPNLLCYQLLNFNPLGGTKYDSLAARNAFASAKPYTQEQMDAFGALLAHIPVTLKVGE